jgi:hypothetical protein
MPVYGQTHPGGGSAQADDPLEAGLRSSRGGHVCTRIRWDHREREEGEERPFRDNLKITFYLYSLYSRMLIWIAGSRPGNDNILKSRDCSDLFTFW